MILWNKECRLRRREKQPRLSRHEHDDVTHVTADTIEHDPQKLLYLHTPAYYYAKSYRFDR